MKIPTDNTLTIDTGLSTVWFDGEGILYEVFRNIPRTPERCEKREETIKTLLQNQPVCCLMDVSNSGIIKHESYELLRREMPNMYKALAIVATTTHGQSVAVFTMALAPLFLPVKIFASREEAHGWLQQYL